MKLDKILTSESDTDTWGNYIHMERYVNRGSPSGFTEQNTVSKPYHPKLGETCFKMPFMQRGEDECRIFLANPDPDLLGLIRSSRNNIRFCLHPETFESLFPGHTPAGHNLVKPTASARTVFTEQEGQPHFAKLHFHRMLGRLMRHLSEKRVEGAAKVSLELDKLTSQGKLDQSFAYLPESIGVVFLHNAQEIGVTYREAKPRPIVVDKRFLIPFFSLFSEDDKSPNDPMLLEQLLRNFDNPLYSFLEKIIVPLINAYRTIVFDGGLTPENHAQNILLEVNSAGLPTRVVHRDLYEFYADTVIRKILGLDIPFKKCIDLEMDPDLGYKTRSYLFDFKFSRYTLDPLAASYCEAFGFDEERLKFQIREIFLSSNAQWTTYFNPYNTGYRLPQIEQTYQNNSPLYMPMDKSSYR